jgi:hypothetical protein
MRNQRRKNRLFRRLALAFAVALVAVPVAQAYPVEVEKAQTEKFIPGVTDFPRSSYIAPEQQSWPGVDPQSPPKPIESVQAVSAPDGFDWGDSGIGAGTAFAVILLAAGALLAVRHVGRQDLGRQATA